MILKIKATDPNAAESWRFFDGVRDLHYSIFNEIGKMNDSLKPQMVVVEGKENGDVQQIWFMGPDNPVEKKIFLSFHSDLTGPTEIYCNTQCYLLNDLGKTIEKLI